VLNKRVNLKVRIAHRLSLFSHKISIGYWKKRP